MPRTATLTNRIPAIIAALDPAVDVGVRAFAESVAAEARDRVHVDSGDLRDAIHVEEVENGLSIMAGDSNVFYGHLEEFGTAHSAAHPFLIPALEAQKEGIAKVVFSQVKL